MAYNLAFDWMCIMHPLSLSFNIDGGPKCTLLTWFPDKFVYKAASNAADI